MEYFTHKIDNRLEVYKGYPKKELTVKIARCILDEYCVIKKKENGLTVERINNKAVLEYADEIW